MRIGIPLPEATMRGGGPGIDLTITQGAAALTVEYRAGGQTPAPVKLTYTLDGSVSKNMMAGRDGGAPAEQVSKAMWATDKLVMTTTTGAGEEKRTFSMEGGNLVVETSAPARGGGAQNITKVTYKRYERGYGGSFRYGSGFGVRGRTREVRGRKAHAPFFFFSRIVVGRLDHRSSAARFSA